MIVWFLLVFAMVYALAATHPFAADAEELEAVEKVALVWEEEGAEDMEGAERFADEPSTVDAPPESENQSSEGITQELQSIREILAGMTIGVSSQPEPTDRPPEPDEKPTVGSSQPTIGASRMTIGASMILPSDYQENVAAIRRNFDVLLYGVLPFFLSAFLLVKFCKWFYCAFIRSAFEHNL